MILFLLFLNAAPPSDTFATPAQAAGLREANRLALRAVAAHRDGRPDTGLPHARAALAAVRAAAGDLDARTAEAINNLAMLLRDAGEHRAAMPLLEQALAVQRRLEGDDGPNTLIGVNNLALLLLDLGMPARARPLFEDVLRRSRDDRLIPAALNNLGLACLNAGEYAAASRHFRAAMALVKPVEGERGPRYLASLDNLAEATRLGGDVRQGLELATLAHAGRLATAGPRHPATLRSLNKIALANRALGRHEEAVRQHRQVLALRRVSAGERHPDTANALVSLGLSLAEAGDHTAGAAMLEDAVRRLRAALGRHPLLANALGNLADLRRDMGDAHLSLPLYREALGISARTQGEAHPEHAGLVNGLALLHHELHDHAEAARLYAVALAARREALGPRHPYVAASLNNLGLIDMEAGRVRHALDRFREAEAVSRAALGKAHPQRVSALVNLARAIHRAGLPGAEKLLREAEAYDRAGGAATLHLLAGTLQALAEVVQARGDIRRACRLDEEAIEAIAASLGERHPQHAITLSNLGLRHYRLGNAAAALKYADRALAGQTAVLTLASHGQSERQHLASYRYLRTLLDHRLWLPDVEGRPGAAEAYRHVLAFKGAVFATQQRRRELARLLAPADRATRALLEDLARVSHRLAHQSMAMAGAVGHAVPAEEMKALARRKDELEAALPGARPEPPLRPEGLSAALPHGATLVDLLVSRRMDARGWTVRPRVVAFITRRGRPVTRVDLGPAGPIAAAVTAWLAEIEAGGPAPSGAVARRLAWAPLEKHLEGAEVILVSPDGVLGRLPFAALPGKKSGTFLIEDVPLAFVPVPRLLAATPAPPRPPSLLAAGAVDFGPGGVWKALPAAGPEADAVRDAFTRRHPALRPLALSGRAATREAVREGLGKVRYAHLATHGVFLPDAPGRHPGSGSGLVLSGAEMLTALEVAEMDLSGMELAVLSACQTGLGKETAGEGMLGLQRAFAVAGCRSVVSSLWSVHDAATGVLMERFYHHLWEKKLSKLESLRQAQIDVLRHPDWVEARVKALLGAAGLRAAGKASERIVGARTERHSPPAWWAAWHLSGDWR